MKKRDVIPVTSVMFGSGCEYGPKCVYNVARRIDRFGDSPDLVAEDKVERSSILHDGHIRLQNDAFAEPARAVGVPNPGYVLHVLSAEVLALGSRAKNSFHLCITSRRCGWDEFRNGAGFVKYCLTPRSLTYNTCSTRESTRSGLENELGGEGRDARRVLGVHNLDFVDLSSQTSIVIQVANLDRFHHDIRISILAYDALDPLSGHRRVSRTRGDIAFPNDKRENFPDPEEDGGKQREEINAVLVG
jgi:hypothetical protein